VRYPEIIFQYAGKAALACHHMSARQSPPLGSASENRSSFPREFRLHFAIWTDAPGELSEVTIIAPSLLHSITSTIGDALMLARAKPDPILITGSLHFAGEVLAHLRGKPAAFEECAQ
jgi:hypothetical protein